MKISYIFLLVFLAMNLSSEQPGDTKQSETQMLRYPSDLLSKGTTSRKVDVILHPIRDFRLLYCDAKLLEARVRSGVCIIDVATRSDNHSEVKIAPNTKLREVLQRAGRGLQHWEVAFQPSLRIVSERAILADTGTSEFLETKISPGDFVVVLTHDQQ